VDVEAVQERVELSQPASSYAAFAESGVAAARTAELVIAAQTAGLVGTADDGVVP
jgi:hypothetical protein